jgi:hypothetical protein
MADETVDYILGNGEELHQAHPRTFFIPPEDIRRSLQPGDRAKLLFQIASPRDGGPGGERMWVEVTRNDSEGYAGILLNQPTALTAIISGDSVRFGPEHVISVPDDRPLLAKKILVSRRSHELDLRPRWIYRETPDREADSGWRAMVGDETDDELSDPATILLQALGFVLDRWPELRPVFQTDPANGSWEWDDDSGTYIQIANEPPAVI